MRVRNAQIRNRSSDRIRCLFLHPIPLWSLLGQLAHATPGGYIRTSEKGHCATTFFAISRPIVVTDEKFLIDLPMDGFPLMDCDNDHHGTLMPLGAPCTPSP